MRDKTSSLKCFQLRLNVDFGVRTGSVSSQGSARKFYGQSKRFSTRPRSPASSREDIQACESNQLPRPSSTHSHEHECISIDQPLEDNINTQLASKGILVGSALRRPHASQYTPLDYQILPQAGRTPRLPYKTNSAGTIYHYVRRPMSAVEQSRQHGRQTKASLLRSQSSSVLTSKTLSATNVDKKLCITRDDYRFYKSGGHPAQAAPHGESFHAFLTGARYNCNQCLDARTLSKLGVYIPKKGLNSFFLKLGEKPKLGAEGELVLDAFSEDEDDDNDGMPSASNSPCVTRPSTGVSTVSTTGVQTDQHFYSINHWHNADWSIATRKEKPKLLTTGEHQSNSNYSKVRKSRHIKACYLDYNTLTPVRGIAIKPQTGSGVKN